MECSNDPDFDEATVLMDRREVPFPNPGDNAVPIPGDDKRARYVRCSATQLWKRDNDYVFALSELQVFSGQDNVALHAQVTSMDSIEYGFWSEPYLVDGFDSRHQLDEDELRWLKGLARRHTLKLELADLTAERAVRVDRVTLGLVISALGGGFSMVALLTTLVLRNRLHRRRETDNLRERIASDLHDEIGSNLGSIALLSEIAPGAASGELAEINRIARETGDSMRDIVWVIRIGHDSLEDLITRLREVAAEMLRNVPFSFKVEPDLMPSIQPDLNFKRNVLLFFKEALHNVIKHASADAVAIRILVCGQRFWLTVCDDGCGFDPAEASIKGGNGLNNLRTRAETLGAEIHIISSPGAGTTIALGGGTRPEIILLDVGLPGMDGIQGIREIKALAPNIHVIILTVFDDQSKVLKAICAGASGYLLKTSPAREIITGIREVMDGCAPMNGRVARLILGMFSQLAPRSADTYGLTERETEILKLMVKGLIKKEIADRLDISFHTVDSHLRNIYIKLHVNTQTGAVAKAIREGIVR